MTDQERVFELTRRCKQFRLQARALAKLVPTDGAPEAFRRASGDVICEVCKLQYWEHPQIESVYLTLLCNGEWVHL